MILVGRNFSHWQCQVTLNGIFAEKFMSGNAEVYRLSSTTELGGTVLCLSSSAEWHRTAVFYQAVDLDNQ